MDDVAQRVERIGRKHSAVVYVLERTLRVVVSFRRSGLLSFINQQEKLLLLLLLLNDVRIVGVVFVCRRPGTRTPTTICASRQRWRGPKHWPRNRRVALQLVVLGLLVALVVLVVPARRRRRRP